MIDIKLHDGVDVACN